MAHCWLTKAGRNNDYTLNAEQVRIMRGSIVAVTKHDRGENTLHYIKKQTT